MNTDVTYTITARNDQGAVDPDQLSANSLTAAVRLARNTYGKDWNITISEYNPKSGYSKPVKEFRTRK